MEETNTPFSVVYDSFERKITEDMYIELTPYQTYMLEEELLLSAIPWFEFPRVDINAYELKEITDTGVYQGVDSDGYEALAIFYNSGYFYNKLTKEEIDILATYMVAEWLGQQLASIELTRMKYTGADFKMSSQANHMHKLQALQKNFREQGFHLQRLYSRRKVDDDGVYRSTFGEIMEESTDGYKVLRRD